MLEFLKIIHFSTSLSLFSYSPNIFACENVSLSLVTFLRNQRKIESLYLLEDACLRETVVRTAPNTISVVNMTQNVVLFLLYSGWILLMHGWCNKKLNIGKKHVTGISFQTFEYITTTAKNHLS